MQYILNGALGEIDTSKYENSDTWIKGLKDTCSYEGKIYCVPYYASARLAVYNKDMLKAGTGSDVLPQNEDDFLKAMDKVQAQLAKKDKRASSLYYPGRYWYAAMSYVAAEGGQIAKYDEGSKEWKASLSTPPEAQKGIQHFIDLVKKYNKADQTKDEQDHANVMANEKAAVIYGQAWEPAASPPVTTATRSSTARSPRPVCPARTARRSRPSSAAPTSPPSPSPRSRTSARSGSPSSPTRSPWTSSRRRTSSRTTRSSLSR